MEATKTTDSYEYDIKYSRLLAVLDYDGVRALQASKILIIGARGLGAEIAKNLVMMGVHQIYTQDNNTIEMSDLSSSILFKEEDIGKDRADILSTRLLEINEDVQVKIHTSNTYDGFDLVCLTEARSEAYINYINNVCRANRTPFIVGDAFGVFGFVFNDFGEQFVDVSNTVDQDMYARYQNQYEANQHQTISFAPFSEFLSNKLDSQRVVCQDSAKANNFVPLLRALIKFQDQHRRCPTSWSTDDVHAIFNEAKQFGGDLDENLITTLAHVSSIDFSPVTSIIGGLMTHEIVKAVTHRGYPVEQILFYECSDVLPQVPPQHDLSTQSSSRYGGLEAIFGRDLVNQIQRSKVLVAGAGSIGCELVKNLVALGVASEDSGGKITIVDEDVVKLSHLSCQMLYRAADLSKNKAEAAADRIKQLTNGKSNVVPWVSNLEDLSYDENMSWSRHDVVFGATSARGNVDDTCVLFQTPLIDCGLMGTRGHVQVIYPHLTTNIDWRSFPRLLPSHSEAHWQSPSNFEHCVRRSEGRVFGVMLCEFNYSQQYLNPDTRHQVPGYIITKSLMYKMIANLPRTSDECIKYAVRDFNVQFNGDRPVPDWILPHQIPRRFVFNIEDPLHVTYVSTSASLIAQVVGLRQGTPITKEHIASVMERLDTSISSIIEAPTNVSEEELDLQLKTLAEEVAQQIKLTRFERDMLEDNRDLLTVMHLGALLWARACGVEARPVVDTMMLLNTSVPKIVTTSSIIAGLATIEFIKRFDSNEEDFAPNKRPHLDPAPHAVTTSLNVQAQLPANYVIKCKDDTVISLSNVMFLMPAEKNRCDYIFHVLTQRLGYRYTSEDSWFFLSKEDCNILICIAEYFINNRSCRKYFNEYLLFIPGENGNNISSVSKVTKPGAPEIDLKTKVGATIALNYNHLTVHLQAMVQFFQQPNIKGYASLIDTIQDESLQPLYEYISSWLFLSDLVAQKDIFIQIKVDDVNVNALADQVANDLFGVIQQHLAPLPITREAHMHGCVVLIISGPPITWWLINQKQKKIALDLDRRGLNLLNISLVNTKQVIRALKKDPRNKQYNKQVFALICKMLGNTLTDDCAKLNKPVGPDSMSVTSVPSRRARTTRVQDLVTRNQSSVSPFNNSVSQIKEGTSPVKSHVQGQNIIA